MLDRSSIPWRADKFLSDNGIVPLQGSSDGEANGSGPDSASEFHTFAFNSITEGLRNIVLPDGASVSFKDPIVSSDHESSSWTWVSTPESPRVPLLIVTSATLKTATTEFSKYLRPIKNISGRLKVAEDSVQRTTHLVGTGGR